MLNNNEKDILTAKINNLKQQQHTQLEDLKHQYNVLNQSLQPLNLVKSTFQNIISSPNLKTEIISGLIGFGTNYLSNSILNQNSKNPLKKWLGHRLKIIIGSLAPKKP